MILGTASAPRTSALSAPSGSAATSPWPGLWGHPISGASMNPAPPFRPNLASTTFTGYSVYVAGPVTSAVVAVVITFVLRRRSVYQSAVGGRPRATCFTGAYESRRVRGDQDTHQNVARQQAQGWSIVTMTAEPPESPVTEGVRSLEVRWIFPGQLETAVAGWFGAVPGSESSHARTPTSLDPQLRGLSVKVRAGGALEVKVYRGSPGILDVAGRARGRMESWQKWSFPFSPLSQDSADPAGWRPVRKRRRISRFSRASGPVATRASGAGPGARGATWNSPRSAPLARIGGPWASRRPARPMLLPGALEATAALVFAQAMPGSARTRPG